MTYEPEQGQLASTDEMTAWIATVVGQGIRRAGYPADRWTEQWAAQRFEDIGLHDVTLEPVPVSCWTPRSATLRAWPQADPANALELTGFPIPYAAATEVTTAPLARLDNGDVAGRLAVDELTLMDVSQSVVRYVATSSYDPEGAFDDLVQTLPFGSRMTKVVDPAVEAGAAGYIGVLTGFPWETRDYYVPYDAVARPTPGLWLSARDGGRLVELMREGPCQGELTVDAATEPATSHNVIGTLPGRGDDWVIIASHHDAPWASAVEDASGIALVLAQARYWSAVPPDERPHNLLFLLTAGHMADAAGTQAFIERNRELLATVVLEVHLEHAARRCVAEEGKLVPTDDPEVRWWFTTQAPKLERLVTAAIAAEDLRRSHVLPPDVYSEMPPTDGAYFHPAGVPLVHFLSAPMYLFDSQDTLDKVDEAGLVPLTRAVARIVAGTRDWTPAELRAAAAANTADPTTRR